MSKKFIQELNKEIPEWVSRGYISNDSADKIRGHYEAGGGDWSKSAVFSIIASLLIGLGVISILAYNWKELSHTVKTVIAFTLLVIPQAIGFYTLWKEKRSAAWREGAAIILTLCIGASIALIGQIYHLPSDTTAFFITWCLLALPLVYFFGSNITALLYLAGITTWAALAQNEGGNAMLFWLWVLLLVPYYYLELKKDLMSNRSIFLLWVSCLSFSVAIGITLEKVLPGLWTVIYGGFFGVLYLTGKIYFQNAAYTWQKPLQTSGTLGIISLAAFFTYEFPWNDVGWDYYRPGGRFQEWAALPDYILTLLLIIIPVILITVAFMDKDREESGFWLLPFGVFPFVSIIGYILAALNKGEIPAMIVFNIYLGLAGAATFIYGFNKKRRGTANGGVFIMLLLIALRFTDEDMSFLTRGIWFIGCGITFLVINFLLGRTIPDNQKVKKVGGDK